MHECQDALTHLFLHLFALYLASLRLERPCPGCQAARFGSLDSVWLLLELRADPGLRNARGAGPGARGWVCGIDSGATHRNTSQRIATGDTALEVARSRVPEYLDFKASGARCLTCLGKLRLGITVKTCDANYRTPSVSCHLALPSIIP